MKFCIFFFICWSCSLDFLIFAWIANFWYLKMLVSPFPVLGFLYLGCFTLSRSERFFLVLLPVSLNIRAFFCHFSILIPIIVSKFEISIFRITGSSQSRALLTSQTRRRRRRPPWPGRKLPLVWQLDLPLTQGSTSTFLLVTRQCSSETWILWNNAKWTISFLSWACQSKPCEQINWKGGLCLVHHHPGDFQNKRPPQKQRRADGLEPKWLQRNQIKQFLTFLFFSPYHCPWHDWLHLFSKFLRNMMRLTLFHKHSQPRSSPFFSAERRMCLIINYRRSVSYWQAKIMSLFQSLSSSNCGSLSGYNSHFCLYCLHRRRLDPVLALPKNSYDPNYFHSLPNLRIQSVPTYSSWSNFASRVVYQLRWQVLCDNAKSVACPDIFSDILWHFITPCDHANVCVAAWSQDIEIDQVCIRIHCNLLITVVEG